MLHSHSSTKPDFSAVFDLPPNNQPAAHFGLAGKSVDAYPMLVPSIAQTAGLNRFVYVVGHSQCRYVFSSIRKAQISLYYEAIFMVLEGDNDEQKWVGDYVGLISRLNGILPQRSRRIYVHLLAEGAEAKSRIVLDLRVENIH